MLNGATSQGHESGWDEMKTNTSTTLTEEDQAGGRRIRCSLLPGLSHPQGQPGGSDRLTERGGLDIPVTLKPQRQGSGWAGTDSITVPPGGWPRSLQRGGAGGKQRAPSPQPWDLQPGEQSPPWTPHSWVPLVSVQPPFYENSHVECPPSPDVCLGTFREIVKPHHILQGTGHCSAPNNLLSAWTILQTECE